MVRTGLEPAYGSYVYLNYIATYSTPFNYSVRLPFRHLTNLRLRTPLCCKNCVRVILLFAPYSIPFLTGNNTFTSIEFFGYTSKFYVLCICEKIVLFYNKHPHPNKVGIQTLTKSICNLLNKSPCSISFCLCLYS